MRRWSSIAQTSGRSPDERSNRHRDAHRSGNTSVSPVTHSRRSDITGRLFGRCSSERLSCDSAMTGTLSSLASDFIEREISEISVARFSPVRRRLHQLQVVDDDEAELAVLLRAGGARASAPRSRSAPASRRSGSAPRTGGRAPSTASPSPRAASRPVRSLCWSSRPTEPIMRIASCDAPISIENTATGIFSIERDVLADVERQRRLAHARSVRRR